MKWNSFQIFTISPWVRHKYFVIVQRELSSAFWTGSASVYSFMTAFPHTENTDAKSSKWQNIMKFVLETSKMVSKINQLRQQFTLYSNINHVLNVQMVLYQNNESSHALETSKTFQSKLTKCLGVHVLKRTEMEKFSPLVFSIEL